MPLPPEIQRIHERACQRSQTGYVDPRTGLFVLTANYLSDRGYCCGAGCRHCPYDADQQRAAGRPAEADTEDWG